MCFVSATSLILNCNILSKIHCRGYKDSSVFKKNCYNLVDILSTHMGLYVSPDPGDPLIFPSLHTHGAQKNMQEIHSYR